MHVLTNIMSHRVLFVTNSVYYTFHLTMLPHRYLRHLSLFTELTKLRKNQGKNILCLISKQKHGFTLNNRFLEHGILENIYTKVINS